MSRSSAEVERLTRVAVLGAQTAEGQSRVGYEVVDILAEYFKP